MRRAPGVAERLADEIVYRYRSGESLRSIGRAVCLSHVAVRQVLSAAGVQVRQVRRPGVAERQQDEIAYRYTNGRQSIRRIAADLGLSYGGVHTALTRARVPLRPTGRRASATTKTSSGPRRPTGA